MRTTKGKSVIVKTFLLRYSMIKCELQTNIIYLHYDNKQAM